MVSSYLSSAQQKQNFDYHLRLLQHYYFPRPPLSVSAPAIPLARTAFAPRRSEVRDPAAAVSQRNSSGSSARISEVALARRSQTCTPRCCRTGSAMASCTSCSSCPLRRGGRGKTSCSGARYSTAGCCSPGRNRDSTPCHAERWSCSCQVVQRRQYRGGTFYRGWPVVVVVQLRPRRGDSCWWTAGNRIFHPGAPWSCSRALPPPPAACRLRSWLPRRRDSQRRLLGSPRRPARLAASQEDDPPCPRSFSY
mmetsp:Transcript_13502/g.33132  ORF Transcript_13502/g.33132 Transcript_13502/m.33132 type:complete len:251 (+) Transcript_13502:257-1009(+)